MKKLTAIISAILLTTQIAMGALTFRGAGQHQVIAVNPESTTGLNNLYVVYDVDGVTVEYTASSDAQVVWYKFGNMGGAYAEEIAVNRDGRTTTLDLSGSKDSGYIVEEGTQRTYYWIVNYRDHYLHLNSLGIGSEQDCSMTTLVPTGNGDRIVYYSITGQQRELSRDLQLSYSTLEYDQDSRSYRQTEHVEVLGYLQSQIHTPAPLCDTDFAITGDRFLKQWGESQQIVSDEYHTVAIDAHAWATQTERDNDNEKRVETQALGGSAPVEVTFNAAVTDAVVFKEWQFSNDREFNDITSRYNETEVTLTFTDMGTTYARFAAANAAGSCDWYSDVYEIFVGESALDCPNAFSPNGDGVNDEWKVSYKSLVKFECHIYNRWGVEMISFTDPSQGWDGKYNGKVVPSGVYYYAITAEGSDGRKYKRGGDINIINFKDNRGSYDPDQPVIE